YFPDPDLLPLELESALVERIKNGLPELPDVKKNRFMTSYGLSSYDAGVLVQEKNDAVFFESVAKNRDAKMAANWVTQELFGALNRAGKSVDESPVSAENLGALIDLIKDGTISGKIAKDVFAVMFENGGDPRKIVVEQGLQQVTDTGAIERVVEEIIAKNPDKVADYRAKPKAIGWFVGEVMKATKGKANPTAVNEILKRKLDG
ncbi:MAG TPA: Asp-tRNA(Asn)/Glu-tRNA(Gln) amidotransferase GatCAB subunit B, partial [Alphaproteobacteria bacterium]|nr:Asp-tRNA(Asn)/Glu-tRNA(Gln) amidotransferase GatCAB subunit B [Alphaproteobacteria bacterium]